MPDREKITVEKTGQFHGHGGPVYNIGPSYRSGHFLTAGSDRILAEWNIETQEAIALAKAESAIFSFHLIPEREMAILGLEDGGIVFSDIKTRKPLAAIAAHQGSIFDFEVFPDGRHLIATDQKGTVSVWDLDKLEKVHTRRLAGGSIRTLQLSPEGNAFWMGSSDNYIRKFDLNLNLMYEWVGGDNSIFRVVAPAGDNRLLSVGRDAHIRIWDPAIPAGLLHEIPAHMYAINDLVYPSETDWFFTGSMDKTIKIWRKTDAELLKVIDFPRNECHKNGVNRMIWLEDQLYSVGDDRLIMSWQIQS